MQGKSPTKLPSGVSLIIYSTYPQLQRQAMGSLQLPFERNLTTAFVCYKLRCLLPLPCPGSCQSGSSFEQKQHCPAQTWTACTALWWEASCPQALFKEICQITQEAPFRQWVTQTLLTYECKPTLGNSSQNIHICRTVLLLAFWFQFLVLRETKWDTEQLLSCRATILHGTDHLCVLKQ